MASFCIIAVIFTIGWYLAYRIGFRNGCADTRDFLIKEFDRACEIHSKEKREENKSQNE